MEPPHLPNSFPAASFPELKLAALGVSPNLHTIQMPDNTSSSQDTQDSCAILPRKTRVLVVGNNRTKRTLVGQEGEVKKAVGLGGWHYIVLGNGEEVKLQRNALQVLELAPDDGQESSSDELTETHAPAQIEILTRPRIRRPPKALSPVSDVLFKRPGSSGTLYSSSSGGGGSHAFTLVNPTKLETLSLRRYKRVFQLPADPAATREELLQAVQQHLAAQVVEEQQVLGEFVSAVKRRYRQQQQLLKLYPSHYGHLLHPQQQQQLFGGRLHQSSSSFRHW